ncbi:DUF4148 domain-containing protein [Burkholderia sp. 22313]|uniref:DUF4148 domain-containing protein n=1 Tax=Burkholderia sp. 22313 TaxID=3453908 RepID=UPI003F833776
MKAARILAVAVLATIPALSFADTGHGLTRADVRADLIRLEKAGYSPAGSEAHYPDDIAAAQNAVAAAQQVARSDQNSPSKSQDDNVADASAPAGRYAAANALAAQSAQSARNAHTGGDDLYAHS